MPYLYVTTKEEGLGLSRMIDLFLVSIIVVLITVIVVYSNKPKEEAPGKMDSYELFTSSSEKMPNKQTPIHAYPDTFLSEKRLQISACDLRVIPEARLLSPLPVEQPG